MMNSKVLLTAAAMAAMLVSSHSEAQTSAAAPNHIGTTATSTLSADTNKTMGAYSLTVINNTNKDIWITWYSGPYYVNGQAGTACVHPGGTAVGDDAADWKSGDGTVVRAELKSGSNCGGKTLNYDGSSAGQKVWTGKPDQNGHMKITITADNSNRLSGSLGY